MRRTVVLFLSVSLLVSSVVVFMPRQVEAAAGLDCWVATFIFRNDSTAPLNVEMTLYDVPTVYTYSATRTLEIGETKSTTLYGFLTSGSGVVSTVTSAPGLVFVGFGDFEIVDDSNCLPSSINDGRINLYDVAAPLAAYCASGGIAVWDIAPDSQGTLAFTAPLDAIHTALTQAASSGQSVLIGQGIGNTFYALPSNQLEFTGPDVKEPSKIYQLIAAGAVCG